jgi:D-arabinose 1-dehydrogenase-like Zn-dependent alcohol dehydrogenase
MRSQQIVEYGKPLEAREKPEPRPQGAEVLLRIAASGVCHSDLHIWDGFFELGGARKADITRGRSLPFTMGHEIVGEVAALGPEARGVKLGDRRIAYPWIGCGQCPICARGDDHLCAKPRQLGVQLDGGYASHVLVPDARYLYDYGAVPSELACTYACSGITAYGALKKVRDVVRGQQLLIVGAGGVGFAGLMLAQAMLEARIVVADIDEAKLEAAKAAGADHVVNAASDGARREVMGLTGGGAAAVVDFVGSAKSAAFGFSCLAANASMVVVGLFGGAFELSTALLPLKNLTLRGSITGSPAEMAELMALVKAGKVKPLPVATRPLDQAQRTLDDLRAGRILGRIVLVP